MATKPTNVTEISTAEERLLKASIEEVLRRKQKEENPPHMKPLEPGEAEKIVAAIDANERLKAELAKISTQGQASMLPAKPAPPPPKEDLPQLKDLITDPKDRLNMLRLIETDMEWKAKESEAKKARKPLVARMKDLLGKYQIGRCGWNEYTVNYYGSERVSIKKEALINALVAIGLQPGVIKNVIEAATVVSTVNTLRITAPGEREVEE